MWTIEVDYQTGDSFHTEEILKEQIGLCWTNKKDAIAVLKIIEEHTEYDDLTNCNYYGNLSEKKQKDRIAELKKRDWFSEQWGSHTMHVINNDGERVYQSAFWAGYFETLHEARVVAVESEDDECVFRPY